MFQTPFHQSKTSPRQSCYKFCSLLLDSTLTHPPIRAPTKCLLAQSFPPQVFLPRTLHSINKLFRNYFFQPEPGSVLAHLFFFRFNFCSSFDTSSTDYDHHQHHQQQLQQHFARLQPNQSQRRSFTTKFEPLFRSVSSGLTPPSSAAPSTSSSSVVVARSCLPPAPQHPSTHNKERNFFHIRLARQQRRLQ